MSPFNFWNSGLILTKLGKKVMPVEETPNVAILNFLKSVITVWLSHELLRWKRHHAQSTEVMYGNGPSKTFAVLFKAVLLYNVKQAGGCLKSTHVYSFRFYGSM